MKEKRACYAKTKSVFQKVQKYAKNIRMHEIHTSG